MSELKGDVLYTIIREALSECNSNGHLGLDERMALSDQIADQAVQYIIAAHSDTQP